MAKRLLRRTFRQMRSMPGLDFRRLVFEMLDPESSPRALQLIESLHSPHVVVG
jgi:hypothetical protein